MHLTSRFNEAMTYASKLHSSQKRKSTDVPYLSHLLGVTALTLQFGGDEDQAIAALLHDAVEDQGGLKTLDEIEKKYGRRVARIVDGCSDSYNFPKKPWLERKKEYIKKLETEPPETRLVSLADKVDNARAIILNLREEGRSTWNKFKGGREGSLWYYREVSAVFSRLGNDPLTHEFARLVAEMQRLDEEAV
jgi:(p)ppGpp synthase/HD superfamily hydrolase